MTKNKLHYIRVALAAAQKDLEQVKSRLEKWLHVDASDPAQIIEWLENHKNGYTSEEDISLQIEIEGAISELKNIIWREEYRK